MNQIASFDIEPPLIDLLIGEAQNLRRSWNGEAPSYIRVYLEQAEWGRDDRWNKVATSLFQVFQALYLIPGPLQDRLADYYETRRDWPDTDTF